MPLDISALERAIARLEEAEEIYRQDTSQALIRDGLVQRFEFTYEISRAMLRRYLMENAGPTDSIAEMTFADLIRFGNQHGLLRSDWPQWRRYRDMRARTSHTYNEAVALDVVAGIPDFLAEARTLRDRLLTRAAE